MIANAIVHYQHVMRKGLQMRKMRATCEDSDMACHQKNWIKFNTTFGEGPHYFDMADAKLCSTKVGGEKETLTVSNASLL